MKKLFFILFSLHIIPLTFATEPCEIDYLKFCEHQDPRIPNMCPEVLGHHLKGTCVITKSQTDTVRSKCSKELKDICRLATGEEFLSQYVCLTNPEKWEKFSSECLKSLVKGNPHH
jgi:hypothetical protein